MIVIGIEAADEIDDSGTLGTKLRDDFRQHVGRHHRLVALHHQYEVLIAEVERHTADSFLDTIGRALMGIGGHDRLTTDRRNAVGDLLIAGRHYHPIERTKLAAPKIDMLNQWHA